MKDNHLQTFDSRAESGQAQRHAELAASLWTEEGMRSIRPLPAPGKDRHSTDGTIVTGEDGFAITSQHERSSLKINTHGGVSEQFRRRVDCFAQAIPAHLQKLVGEKGVGISVYATSDQLPEQVRNMQVRRHASGETYGHLPMFYDPTHKQLVFVEKPKLTAYENTVKQSFDNAEAERRTAGVQSYGRLAEFDPKSISYDPIERNGWHELGHAVDKAGLGGFSQTKEFQAAFMKDLEKIRIPESSPDPLEYYVRPETTTGRSISYAAAREELFAELFAISRLPIGLRKRSDAWKLESFPKVARVISRHALLKP